MGKNNTKDIKPKTKGHNRNPTGKGGFKDNPENRNAGYWSSEDSIGFQYKKLIKLTVDEFKTWINDNPEKQRTIAQELAYQAVIQARKDLAYLKEVTDRTEGRASQSIDMTTKGEKLNKFDDEQIDKIIGRLTKGKRGGSDISSEKKSN